MTPTTTGVGDGEARIQDGEGRSEELGGPCGCYSHNGFLTRAGYSLVESLPSDQAILPLGGLTRDDHCVRLDTQGSVSALVEVEGALWLPEVQLENQYQRFLHGS